MTSAGWTDWTPEMCTLGVYQPDTRLDARKAASYVLKKYDRAAGDLIQCANCLDSSSAGHPAVFIEEAFLWGRRNSRPDQNNGKSSVSKARCSIPSRTHAILSE